jgi:thiol-disulfide isomerase/thioredoxin
MENGKTNENCPACKWLKTDYDKWAKNWRIVTK